MADEEHEEAGGAGSGGGVLKKYGPLAAIVLLAQVVLAWVVIQVTLKDKVAGTEEDQPFLPQVEQQRDQEEGTESKELPFYLKRPEALGRITANPAGTNAQRFVVVGVELGLTGSDEDGEAIPPKDIEEDSESLKKIDANLGKIQSVVIATLGRKYIDQYETEMHEIGEEIRRELNRQVFEKIPWDKDGQKVIEVSEVLFTHKIIQ